jgi:ribokinase
MADVHTDGPWDVVCVASWNADLVSEVERPLRKGETMMASHFSIGPGGKGSNASVAAARQGARVALIARIGDDDFGRMGLRLWQNEGIDFEHVERAPGESSGVAQIWVYADGDNSVAVCPGAGSGLQPSHADAARARLEHCRVVMASCEVPLDVTERAFVIARQAGATTVLNPAPAQPLPDSLMRITDVLTPNETEVRLLAQLPVDAPVSDAAQRLLARGAAAVVVTLGASGCTLYRPQQAPVHLPGQTMAVVDSIGAGDTFTGTLAAALARGESLSSAMVFANAAAALSVTGAGAIGGMPTLAQTQALMLTLDDFSHPDKAADDAGQNKQ